ncbi:MAG: rhomboid family intramembrane serine protease [Verrucomicrobia bacterium]|nr:rhomboid family intramembrane serine protease [Verrucomicrobiota bacterium]MDA1065653.1 rhomboid family intramembrane serine protease [Verrucomicrobiota bacterium]
MQNDFSQSESEDSLKIAADRSIIALFPTIRKAHEAGLAVLAAGSAYWVYPYAGQFALVVAEKEARRLSYEVRIFGLKNRFWPAVSPSLSEKQISVIPSYLFLMMLVVVFFFQGSIAKLDDLGMNSSSGFWENREWWRIVTAVTLHADVGHLMGNLFGMGLFGYLTARYLGNGLGWLSILTTAVSANLTNNILHLDSTFYSLGASTAVFGALGLVTGFPIGSFFRTGEKITKRQWIIPLAGGVMLLAWLGSGDARTDVAAHLWSFIFGLMLASGISKLNWQAVVTKTGQLNLLITTWIIIIGCWIFALTG